MSDSNLNSGIFNTLGSIHRQYPQFKAWNETQEQREAKRKQLAAQKPMTPEETAIAQQRGQRLMDSVTLMDTKSEEVAEGTEEAVMQAQGWGVMGTTIASMYAAWKLEVAKFFPKATQIHKSYGPAESLSVAKKVERSQVLFREAGKTIGRGLAIFLIPPAIVATLLSVWGAKVQVEGSRVGRDDARAKLSTKDFVIYTPEQQAEANRIAASIPDSVLEAKHKAEKPSFLQSNLNPLSFIGDLAHTLNNRKKSNENSEALSQAQLANLSPEAVQQVKEDQQVLNRVIKQINNKAEQYSENMETTAGVLLGSSVLFGGVIGHYVNKWLPKAKKIEGSSKVESVVLGLMQNYKGALIGSAIAGLIGGIIAMSMQKEAARAGRFTAKEELRKDSNNFRHLSEAELDTMPDKALPKKGFFNWFTQPLKVIPESLKAWNDYRHFKKDELPALERQALAFQQIAITPEQEARAALFKQRTFSSFERIDEKSQKYTEDVEATTEIALNLTSQLTTASMYLVPLGLAIYKRPWLLEKTSQLLAKGSNSSWFKNLANRSPKRLESRIAAWKPTNSMGDGAAKALSSALAAHKDSLKLLLDAGSLKPEEINQLFKQIEAHPEVVALLKDKQELRGMLKAGKALLSEFGKKSESTVATAGKEAASNPAFSTKMISKQIEEATLKGIRGIEAEVEALADDAAVQAYVANHPKLALWFDGKVTKKQLLETIGNGKKRSLP